MRCKNCGWPNKPGATHCSKCNSPLGETIKPAQAPADPVPAAAPADQGRQWVEPTPLGGTVFEDEAFPSKKAPARGTVIDERTIISSVPDEVPVAPKADAPKADAPKAESLTCPKCGYPLRPDTDKCPNCRFQLRQPAVASEAAATVAPVVEPVAPKEEAPKAEYTRQATVGAWESMKENKAFTGTINPLVQRIIPEFTLTLQPRDGEVLKNEKLEFEGETTSLNRDNVEPGNNSITSKEQARIVFEDGKWYIEDKSAFKTTFVQCGHKMELHNGDTILMGSRLMTFNCEEND